MFDFIDLLFVVTQMLRYQEYRTSFYPLFTLLVMGFGSVFWPYWQGLLFYGIRILTKIS